MARTGLGSGWRCLFANDVDPAKAAAYRANFGDAALVVDDILRLSADDLPGCADLVWGSFPCQDLSVAGAGAGLRGERSGTFHALWRLVEALGRAGRAPRIVALENVCGALTSDGGRDFHAICTTLARGGYRPGALVIDAELFTPQSRPRLFVVALKLDAPPPERLVSDGPAGRFHTAPLRRAVETLPMDVAERWLWWRLPEPSPRRVALADILDAEPDGVRWRSETETARLLSLMSPLHLAKVTAASLSGRTGVGSVYRRTRDDGAGCRAQRAEVRFDGVAGCLRTPAGGSSRQLIVVVEGEQVRSRLLSPRETARLMGLPDSYRLPATATAAYHLTGDGVVAPVVAHLAHFLLEPLLGFAASERLAA